MLLSLDGRGDDWGVVMSKCFRLWNLVQPAAVSYALAGLLVVLTYAPAQAEKLWTLEDSIQRVLEIAPEVASARAVVEASQGALDQAGAWPNPNVQFRGDDRIGKDSGTGGNNFTQFAFNQPIPLTGRLGYQKEIASAQLGQAEADRAYQQLQLESETARRFHMLQLAARQLELAEQRIQLADEMQLAGRRRAQAGELSELESLRLDLIRESAKLIRDRAEGRFNEAVSQFRAFLSLPARTIPTPSPLVPFGPVPTLESLRADLVNHPALQSAKYQLEASRAQVKLAKTQRLPDPVLSYFREQDFLNGRIQPVNGVGLSITLPLWDRKRGRLGEMKAQVARSRSGMDILQRDLSATLEQTYVHLNHLTEQGEYYRVSVYSPAERVFSLTRKAYAAGEVEILALIDANQIYFDTYDRYLQLLQEAWLAAADLRLAAGHRLVTEQEIQP